MFTPLKRAAQEGIILSSALIWRRFSFRLFLFQVKTGLMDCQLRKSKVGTRRALNRSVGNRGDGQDGLKEKYCWNGSVLNSKVKKSWMNIPI